MSNVFLNDDVKLGRNIPTGDWQRWLILNERGWGKSTLLAQFAMQEAARMPASIGLIVTAHSDDIQRLIPPILWMDPLGNPFEYFPARRQILFSNGSKAWVGSGDNTERLRGMELHWAIVDDYHLWEYDKWLSSLEVALRLGDQPRYALAASRISRRGLARFLDERSYITSDMISN